MTPQPPPPHNPAPRRTDLQVPLRLSRWALWGCITLVLVGVFLLLGLFLVLFRSPDGRTSLVWSRNLTLCERNMDAVAGAMDRHYRDKGNLPAKLESLNPTYLRNKDYLHCPADPQEDRVVSYRYFPRTPWGEGRGIVVYCPHHPLPSVWKRLARDNRSTYPAVLSNGTADQMVITPSELPGGGKAPVKASGPAAR